MIKSPIGWFLWKIPRKKWSKWWKWLRLALRPAVDDEFVGGLYILPFISWGLVHNPRAGESLFEPTSFLWIQMVDGGLHFSPKNDGFGSVCSQMGFVIQNGGWNTPVVAIYVFFGKRMFQNDGDFRGFPSIFRTQIKGVPGFWSCVPDSQIHRIWSSLVGVFS